MNSGETEEATRKRRAVQLAQSEFYTKELQLITSYRDYMKCVVETMQLEFVHAKLMAEREDWESARKKEEEK